MNPPPLPILDFQSVNTAETSLDAASFDTSGTLEVRALPHDRAPPQSLSGRGDFDILLIDITEEDVLFADEHEDNRPSRSNREIPEEDVPKAKPRKFARFLLIALAVLVAVGLALAGTLGAILGKDNASSSSSSSEPTPPILIPTLQISQPVNATFLVSNTEGITDPAAVINSGLAEAWPIFVENVVNKRGVLSNKDDGGRRLRRRLLEAGDAFISRIVLVNCPGGEEGMTCHQVLGIFTLLVEGDQQENGTDLVEQISAAIVQAIQDGLLADVLQEINPGTSLADYVEPTAAGHDGFGSTVTPTSISNPLVVSKAPSEAPPSVFDTKEPSASSPSAELPSAVAYSGMPTINPSSIKPDIYSGELILEFQYDFLDNQTPRPSNNPTDQQLSALVCQTQLWVSNLLQEIGDNPGIYVTAHNISYNTSSATMSFAGEIQTWDNSPLPSEEQVKTALLYSSNHSSLGLPNYTVDYAHEATPFDGSDNHFRNVETVTLAYRFEKGRAGEPQLEKAVCSVPTYSGQFNMELQYGFFDNLLPLEDPTNSQLAALACQTQAWLTKELQEGADNAAIVVTALNISYNTNRAVMSFTAEIVTWDGSPLPEEETVVQNLNPTTNPNLNMTDYVLNYIYGAITLHDSDNYFRNVNAATFAGAFGLARSGDFALNEAVCTMPKAPIDPGHLHLEFSYNFLDNFLPSGDPSDAQLSALVCETQRWLSGALQAGSGNPAILLEAHDISYNQSTATMAFIGSIQTWDGSPVPTEDQIVSSLDLFGNPSLNFTDYIINYVRRTSPMGSDNYFAGVNGMSLVGEFGHARSEFTLEEVVCAAHTYSGQFNMEFSYDFYDNLIPSEDPSNTQLSTLACQTQRWLTKTLQEATGNQAVYLKAQRILYINDRTAMAFSADIGTWDASGLPDEKDVVWSLDPASNPSINMASYLIALPDYFGDVNSMTFSGDFGPGRPGEFDLAETTCADLDVPLAEHDTPVSKHAVEVTPWQ